MKRMCLVLLLTCPSLAIGTEMLSMATSNGPPYMIQSSGSGLDIDIPREALRRAGYELTIRYMPLARARGIISANIGLRAMIRDGTHDELTKLHLESLPILK